METQSQVGTREKILKVVIMLAACFAIGSVGFFIAVLLQHTAAATPSSTTIQPVAEQISTSSKESIVENLNSTNSTTVSSSTSVSASTTATQTAAKLKILQGLNAH